MKTKGEGSNSRRSEIEDQNLKWERKDISIGSFPNIQYKCFYFI